MSTESINKLKNNLLTHHYINKNIEFEFNDSPFKHLVINNFFNDDLYPQVCNIFPSIIARAGGKQHGKVGSSDKFYNAIITSVNPNDGWGYDFFASKLWKDSISEFFDIELNQHLSYSAHYHEGSKEHPSKNGWVHLDLNICSAIDDESQEIKPITDCTYTDDTLDWQPHTKKIVRSIAVLYYLNNPDNISEEDGGGTGIYKNYNIDSLIKQVPPKNNSVFIFEISPQSYHAFVGAKYNRSSIIHWFHSNPSYFVKRNFELFKNKFHKNNGEIFERWSRDRIKWTLDKDPDYNKYFNKPYPEIFS